MTMTPDVSLDGGGGGSKPAPKPFDRAAAERMLKDFGGLGGKGMLVREFELLGTDSNSDLWWGHPEFGKDEFGTMTNDAVHAIEDLVSKGTYDDDHDGELDYAEVQRFVDANFASPELNAETVVKEVLPDEVTPSRTVTPNERSALNTLAGWIHSEYGGARPK